MRLKGERSRPNRIKSAELVGRQAEEPDRLFDPELDLPPGEYDRLRGKIRRTSNILGPGKITTYPELGWLTMVDPSARQDLRGIPGYKDFLVSEVIQRFNRTPTAASEWQKQFQFLAKVLQQFPETRTDFDGIIHSTNLDLMLKFIIQDRLTIRHPLEVLERLFELIQIWPMERKKILDQFFPQGFQERAFAATALSTRSELGNVHLAAQTVVLFPEVREKVLSITRSAIEQAKAQLKELSQSSTASEFANYQRAIRDLVILNAEQAWIDTEGLIQIQNRPLKPQPVQPLPDRLLS